MNTVKKFLALALLISFAAVTAKDDQVVVVDLMRVGSESMHFKAKQEDLKKILEPEAKGIENAGKAFQLKVADFESKASTMSDSKKQEEGQKLAATQQKLQGQQQTLQSKAQKIMAEVEKELVDMVRKVCKKLEFKVVVPNALYVHDAHDKTSQVIAELNKTTKSAAKTKLA
jgi:outer membrane protein